MNGEADPTALDDVGRAVRDLATSWTMPPAAREVAGWRDRIAPAGAIRRRWPSWGRPVVAAAGLALTISIAAALLAVWLVLPPRGGPGPGASGQPSSTPRPTPNPALLYSAPPTADAAPHAAGLRPLWRAAAARAGPGQRGQRSRPARPEQRHLDGHRPHGRPRERPGLPAAGRRVPVRLYHQRRTGVRGHLDHDRHGHPTVGRSDGAAERSVVLPSYVGQADPHVAGEPSHAAITASLSPDSATLFLGWAVERPPAWRSGIDVVDLAAGRIVQTVGLRRCG